MPSFARKLMFISPLTLLMSGCLAPWPGRDGQNTALVYRKEIVLEVTNPGGDLLSNATLATGDHEPSIITTEPVFWEEGTMYTLDAGNYYRETRFRINAGLTPLHTLRISLDHLLWPNKTCHEGGRKLEGKLYIENEAPIENGVIEVKDRQAFTDDSGAFNRSYAVLHDQSQATPITKTSSSTYRMQITLVKNGDTDTLLDVFPDDSSNMIDPK